MELSESERCWIWLSSVSGMSARRFYKLLAVSEDAENVFRHPGDYKRFMDGRLYDSVVKSIDDGGMDKLFEDMEKNGISAVTRLSDLYPFRLEHITATR